MDSSWDFFFHAANTSVPSWITLADSFFSLLISTYGRYGCKVVVFR